MKKRLLSYVAIIAMTFVLNTINLMYADQKPMPITFEQWQKMSCKEQQAWKAQYLTIDAMPIVGKSKTQVGDRCCGEQVQWCKPNSPCPKQCPKEKKEKKHHHHHKVKIFGPCGGKGISQKDVNKNGTGFIITKSGEYFLEKDIAFDPSMPNAAAITIDADNVVLHLCNKTLSQESSNTQPGTMGILINGRENVSIDGGTIRDFNTFGIFGNPGNNIMSIDQVNVINCGTTALGLVGGAFILPSELIRVENCNFLENFGVGLGVAGCNDFHMNNSSCDNTQGSIIFPFGTTAIGFLVNPFPVITPLPAAIPSEDIVLTNCSFSGTNGTFEAFGAFIGSFYSVSQIRNVVIENCVSIGTSGGAFSDEVEGFGIIASNVVVKNCVADDVVAGVGTPFSGQARGFRIIGENVLYEDCVASNIIGSGQTAAVGFSGEYTARQVTWRQCTAYNVTNLGTPGIAGNADAYGFASVIPDSFLIPIIIPSPVFNFNLGVGNIFESCIAENVTVTGNGSTAAGFRISSQQNVNVQNCVSNNNGSYGLWMRDEIGTPSLNGIIQSNTIEGNGVAGIQDDTADSNAYFANVARSNDGPGSNYVGVPGGTPIAIWTIPGPVPTINPLDNLDIRP